MRRVLVSVAMVLGLAGPWLLAARCREREVHTLPPAERAAFVQRTLANLEGPCAQAEAPALTDACRAQAELLLEFPECDEPCRQLVQRVTHRPTR